MLGKVIFIPGAAPRHHHRRHRRHIFERKFILTVVQNSTHLVIEMNTVIYGNTFPCTLKVRCENKKAYIKTKTNTHATHEREAGSCIHCSSCQHNDC